MLKERTRIHQRLSALRTVQAVYMPVVPNLLEAYLRDHDGVDAEVYPLYLPHSVSPEDLDRCSTGLADIEARLRDGQLRDSLDNLRFALHHKSRLLTSKALHTRHQGPNTRAHNKLDDQQERIAGIARKYRLARAAKLELCGPGAWEQEFRVLKNEDIRCIQDDDPQVGAKSSEGRRAVSWIWKAASRDSTNRGAAKGELDDSECK